MDKGAVLQSIHADLNKIESEIIDANVLIGIARSAGEDVAAYESAVRGLEIKKEKWKRALNDHGVTV